MTSKFSFYVQLIFIQPTASFFCQQQVNEDEVSVICYIFK